MKSQSTKLKGESRKISIKRRILILLKLKIRELKDQYNQIVNKELIISKENEIMLHQLSGKIDALSSMFQSLKKGEHNQIELPSY